METVSLGPSFMAAFFNPGAWGREFTSVMDQYVNMAGMWIVGEDMPQESNRITLNDGVKDRFGMPVANVHYDDHPNDLAMREHAFVQGEKLYNAVDAVKVHRVPPYPSTHNLGTCRMSAKAQDGVCNGHGQSHEIPNLFISDGSQFTTSAGENPTLTIVTLAIRQAEFIADALKTKAI
jgi:choline dehydrogenase-like flavoprotein